MYRCSMGYEVKEDLTPPERCHSDGHPDSCKDCRNYNSEYDLVNQAIELMQVTIRALEFYRDEG